MKKITALMFCLAAVLCAAPASAAQSWDQFVAQIEQQQQIKAQGPQIIAQIASQAPAVSNQELWRLSCSAPTVQQQAAASVALVNRLFPNGDPSQWQQINGFFPPSSYIPLQVVAINALFNAVTALSQMPEGRNGAVYLLNQFSQSPLGMVLFIETMPAQFRQTLDTLIAQTGMSAERWSSTTIEGPYPFVPVYRWYTTYETAISNNYQFLNGWGQIASNGPYAWDRVQGYLYQIDQNYLSGPGGF